MRPSHQRVVGQQHSGDDISDLRTRLQAAQVGADLCGRHITPSLEQLPGFAPLFFTQVVGHFVAGRAIASMSQSLANSQ